MYVPFALWQGNQEWFWGWRRHTEPGRAERGGGAETRDGGAASSSPAVGLSPQLWEKLDVRNLQVPQTLGVSLHRRKCGLQQQDLKILGNISKPCSQPGQRGWGSQGDQPAPTPEEPLNRLGSTQGSLAAGLFLYQLYLPDMTVDLSSAVFNNLHSSPLFPSLTLHSFCCSVIREATGHIFLQNKALSSQL